MTLPTLPLLTASFSQHPSMMNNIQYQITGMLVVFFTLGVLAFMMSILGKIFAIIDARKTTTETALVPAASTGTTSDPEPSGDIPAPIFAVIAAAVATTLGDRRFNIQGVRIVDPRENLAWSAEGRRSIYAGKKLR